MLSYDPTDRPGIALVALELLQDQRCMRVFCPGRCVPLMMTASFQGTHRTPTTTRTASTPLQAQGQRAMRICAANRGGACAQKSPTQSKGTMGASADRHVCVCVSRRCGVEAPALERRATGLLTRSANCFFFCLLPGGSAVRLVWL